MSITGNLKTMELAELLQWLSQGRKTGTLYVDNGKVEKRIFFKDGTIVSSAASDPKEYLGHFLVSKGVISEDDLASAMRLQAEQGRLLGEILVEDVREKLGIIPTAGSVTVDLVFDPPWNHSMMSEVARLETGMF